MSNILIVDDERGVRESLNILLSSEGHQIDTADNGLEALRRLQDKTYDLVLTDIVMPEMDGLNLIKQIRQRFQDRTSVIIISAYGSIQHAMTAVREGAVDFIIKPFEINQIREVVEHALHHERKILQAELQRKDVETRRLHQLNDKLDRTVFELSILHEVGKTINSTLDIQKIVSIILEMARQTVDADQATLVLFKPGSEEIELQIQYSALDGEAGHKLSLPARRAMQWVRRDPQPLLIENVDRALTFKDFLGDTEQIRSLILVPLKRNHQLLGAVLLTKARERDLGADDLNFVSILANQAAIAIENAQLYQETQSHVADTIRALVTAVEAKDTYTFGHSERVTQYSLLMAERLGLNTPDVRRLEYLALLHDVGKIGIDEKILRKDTALTEEEWRQVRNHAPIGGGIVKPIKFLLTGEDVVRHHHERYSGSGYPDGLCGEGIPLFSRIIAVADSFDAMTSRRPYRKTLTAQQALQELIRCAGEQFDPALVDLFTNAYGTDLLERVPQRH